MKGKATLILRGKRVEVDARGTLRNLLDRLDLNPEIHLILVNGKLKEEDYRLKDGDEIKIIRVISGG